MTEWTAGMDAAQLRACIARFEEERAALRVENTRLREALEAGLRDCKRYAEDHDDEWVPQRVDDALAEAAAIRARRGALNEATTAPAPSSGPARARSPSTPPSGA
jgi:hypothetical protein